MSNARVVLQDVEMQDADGKPSMAEQIREEVRRLLERLPPDALQPSDWAPPTELAWHTLLTSATSPRVCTNFMFI